MFFFQRLILQTVGVLLAKQFSRHLLSCAVGIWKVKHELFCRIKTKNSEIDSRRNCKVSIVVCRKMTVGLLPFEIWRHFYVMLLTNNFTELVLFLKPYT